MSASKCPLKVLPESRPTSGAQDLTNCRPSGASSVAMEPPLRKTASSMAAFCFKISLEVSKRCKAEASSGGAAPPAPGVHKLLATTIVPSKAMAAALRRCSSPSCESPPNAAPEPSRMSRSKLERQAMNRRSKEEAAASSSTKCATKASAAAAGVSSAAANASTQPPATCRGKDRKAAACCAINPCGSKPGRLSTRKRSWTCECKAGASTRAAFAAFTKFSSATRPRTFSGISRSSMRCSHRVNSVSGSHWLSGCGGLPASSRMVAIRDSSFSAP
mmetsp:Transcript_89678/g.142709  ORF Transcript_89678/g.142709 Transcript_89678/m.142709 type:complete len:275 (-) Transcript_89678:272-1096(-)